MQGGDDGLGVSAQRELGAVLIPPFLDAGIQRILVNDADAAALGIADGDRVRVTSRRGSLETTAYVSDKTNPGQTWMPFHFQDGNSNWLAIAALDPVSKAPEYKVCAVRVEKA